MTSFGQPSHLDNAVDWCADFEVVSEAGSGRAFIILTEAGTDALELENIFSVIAHETRAILLRCSTVGNANWKELTSGLTKLLAGKGIRQGSFLAFGAACSLIQQLCLTDPKIVRAAVLVNPTSRPHQSAWSKFIDRLEESLPLGLPLRLSSIGFDSRPFLQRIRCPILIATTPQATAHELAQAQEMSVRIPTAWLHQLPNLSHLAKLVLEFRDVPAKCPMGRGA